MQAATWWQRVSLSAGVLGTPAIPLRSRIHSGRRMGRTFTMHLFGRAVAVMDEPVDPWVGATQGWGAVSPDISDLKNESLWALPSLIMVKWGGLGQRWVRQIRDARNVCVVVAVCRGWRPGRVRVRQDGTPSPTLWSPRDEVYTLLRGLKVAVDGMLDVGACVATAGISSVSEESRTPADEEHMLSTRTRASDEDMVGNPVFGSCRMSAALRKGAVDLNGEVRGAENLYIMDKSICPDGTVVNTQATIMAMSDILSRRLGDLQASP